MKSTRRSRSRGRSRGSRSMVGLFGELTAIAIAVMIAVVAVAETETNEARLEAFLLNDRSNRRMPTSRCIRCDMCTEAAWRMFHNHQETLLAPSAPGLL